jgi:membrane associated rhomboid family serine protease
MFPLRDHNPPRHPPIATMGVIAANGLAWALIQGLGSDPALARSVCTLGLVPGELLGLLQPGTSVEIGPGVRCVIEGQASWWTPLTSMFMHGGWFHILGNMWFLWVFGDNVEEAFGHVRYVLFYLTCGLAAAAAQVLADPTSAVPMVGASGAIGGVMGAYALLYPRARVDLLLIFGFLVRVVPVPAVFMLGYWFLLQLLSGALAGAQGGGVAVWAHVGGFLAGILLALTVRGRVRPPSRRVPPGVFRF